MHRELVGEHLLVLRERCSDWTVEVEVKVDLAGTKVEGKGSCFGGKVRPNSSKVLKPGFCPRESMTMNMPARGIADIF